jgi:hypothetical protein
MSSERIRIALELVDKRFPGDGPADVLERLGQELDLREVDRIRRERDI